MNSNDFLQIEYDAFFYNENIEDFNEIEIFKEEIKNNYNSSIKANGVGRGGGAYEFLVHFISDLSLSSYLKLVGLYLTKKTIDQITNLSIQKFLFIPLQKSYQTLKNKNTNLDCHSFQIEFEDVKVFIYKTSDDSLIPNLHKIIREINNQIEKIESIVSKEQIFFKPTEIHIPAILDIVNHQKIYRTPMGIEETINNLDKKDYFKYWGIRYFHNQLDLIYDVKNQSAITQHRFYTEEQFKSIFDQDY